MILISQWYEPSCDVRRRELLAAKTINESSGVFERIHYVNGTRRKWTYGELIGIASREYRGKVCVVANTDIAFDHTASLIAAACKTKMVIALTRWEGSVAPNMLGHLISMEDQKKNENWHFSGTQDAWAFVAGSLPEFSPDVSMGIQGCEQVLLGKLVRAGCLILSPSLDIRIRHVHETPSDYEGKPFSCGEYAYPRMTTLCDTEGYVVRHECPCPQCRGDTEGKMSTEVIRTCQS
jgi:hypothetical protein